MAKRPVKRMPKRVKAKKPVTLKRQKTTQAEFLFMLIAQTSKYLNLSDGRPDNGAVAQLARLESELAGLNQN